MSNIKDLQTMLAGNIDYKNFSEEVTILSETKANAGYSLYTIKNKNGVTFQNVPGNSNIGNTGILGFINGDRGRPTLLGAGTKVNNTESSVASVWTDLIDITPIVLTIIPAADNYLDGFNKDTGHGGDVSLFCNPKASPNVKERPILKFDFSSLTAGPIASAILSLYFFSKLNSPEGRTHWAYRITETGWTVPGSTWNNFTTGSPWATAGGDFTTTDGVSAVVPASINNWMSYNVTAQVQYARDNVSDIAHFLIKDDDESGSTNHRSIFHSSDYLTDTSLRPKLVITL